MSKEMYRRIEVEEVDQKMELVASYLLNKAAQGGIRFPGESLTIMLEDMIILNPDHPDDPDMGIEGGSWELRLKRVS